jgi:hypothetical protein
MKDTMRRIEAVHGPLAAHLEQSINTGNLCSYEPAEPADWRC